MIMEILLEIDRIANWILGGDRRETISSRMARNMHLSAFAYHGCKLLDLLLLDKNHCEEAKTKYENLDSNDHPLVFAFLLVGIFGILVYIASQIVDKLS